ncbi:MAG: hypothetical protein M1817_005182 [Caeruleum heppii]|nr:MAG: hypothetical protein M1817_005182 [Caeruleum heppii]
MGGPQGEGERPVIVDETFSSPEVAGYHLDGDSENDLLAGADFALLSMSEHGKALSNNISGYPSTRSFEDEAYDFAQPPFVSHHQFPFTELRHASSDVLPESVSPYEALTSSNEQLQSDTYVPRFLPRVYSYGPAEGFEGTRIHVNILATYDLTTHPFLAFSLMFGSQRCNSDIVEIESEDHQYYRYQLTANAPPFESTGWVDPEVALYLQMEDAGKQSLGAVEVGEFTYTAASAAAPLVVSQPATSSPNTAARKRKSSHELDSSRAPAKRTSFQRLHSSQQEDLPGFPFTPGRLSPHSTPYLQPPGTSEAFTMPAMYQRSLSQTRYGQPSSLSQPRYQQPEMPVASSRPKTHTPQTPSWGSSYTTISSQASRSPRLSTASGSTIPPLASPATPTNPPLIRTSTIPHSPASAMTPSSALHAGQAFNPYAMYPHKALLKIQGNLDAVADDWTPEEWASKRRIVRFHRSQSGSTINTSFKITPVNEVPPQCICVSCIWWEEKQECFVTSVDTIHLLESLVAVRFTVEEKNRIRRNLEGFKPLTVSKAKPDSEEFFKIIMGFPNPKPRNIEKDVKVFPWKILAHALKKIIGKYSASYSSTAAALLTPTSGPSYSAGMRGSSLQTLSGYEHPSSPRLMVGPSSTPSYGTSLAESVHAAETRTLGGPTNLRSSVSQPLAASMVSTSWTTPQQQQQQQQREQPPQQATTVHPQSSTQILGRGSWDFGHYLDASPTTAGAGADGEAVRVMQQPVQLYPRSTAPEPNITATMAPYSGQSMSRG